MKTEPTEKEKLIEGLEVEIRNCQDDLDAKSWAYEDGILISKREAIALLDLAKSSPKIKKLEWVEDYGYIMAETPFLKYLVSIIGGEAGLRFDGNDEYLKFRTVDEAKAAAQADFEKRVKKCLM